MNSEHEIIRLLTEIRDQSREEIAWRKKVMDESLKISRLGLRRQKIALVSGLVIVTGGILFLIYLVFFRH